MLNSFYKDKFSFVWYKYLGISPLGYIVGVSLALQLKLIISLIWNSIKITVVTVLDLEINGNCVKYATTISVVWFSNPLQFYAVLYQMDFSNTSFLSLASISLALLSYNWQKFFILNLCNLFSYMNAWWNEIMIFVQ